MIINKFNNWYEGIQEPWRFVTALSIAMPVFILMAMDSVPLILAGWFYAFILLTIRITGRYRR